MWSLRSVFHQKFTVLEMQNLWFSFCLFSLFIFVYMCIFQQNDLVVHLFS